MRPRLSHRLALQANTTTRNQYGEKIDAWATVDTVYGDVAPLSARELLRAGAERSLVTHRATIRHRDTDGGWLSYVTGDRIQYVAGEDMTMVRHRAAAQRVSYDSRTFDIVSVTNVNEGHKYDRLMLREVAA